MKSILIFIFSILAALSCVYGISGKALVLSNIDLRDVPDFDAEMCCSLAQWDTVEIIEETDEWFKVRKASSEGWAAKFSFSILSFFSEEIEETTMNDPHQPVQTNIIDAEDYSCSRIIVDEYDNVTGETTTHLNKLLRVSNDNEKGFVIDLYLKEIKGYNFIVIRIGVVGAGHCIDDEGQANILFRDGERLELVNKDGFNCKGMFAIYLSRESTVKKFKKQLNFLSSKEVEILRVWTSNGYVEEKFTVDQSKILMNAINCLSKY